MQGARIASASWGTPQTSYVAACKEIDALARQRDMLILVAAGELALSANECETCGAGTAEPLHHQSTMAWLLVEDASSNLCMGMSWDCCF